MRMAIKDLKEIRKQMFDDIERKLREKFPKGEDGMFYYHSSEERIVLSHVLFFVMSQKLKGSIRQEKCLLLLRQVSVRTLDLAEFG